MKIIKETTINEMAMDQMKAIDSCYSLGKKFIFHFHKIYKEGKDSPCFKHHCIEMQAWLDKCREFILKSTKRPLTPCDLIDWFFTATGSIDENNGFNSYEEIDVYNDFMLKLASDRKSKVIDVANKIL